MNLRYHGGSMAETAHSSDHTCRNCGYSPIGAYCPACGQAEHDGHPPTIGHFGHQLLHEFLHVDGTIFRTLKALFFQPGKLTEEYWTGHVVRFVRPIRIFLIVAGLHLLVSTGVGPLNFQVLVTESANRQLHLSVSTTARLNDAANIPAGYVPVPEEQRRKFAEEFEKGYHTIRYSSVLLFALAAWLVYRRKQPYFVSNLIFSLHFYGFWYALAMVDDFAARWRPDLRDLSLLSSLYLFLALGRLFHERWYVRLGKTVALFFSLLAIEGILALAAGLWAVYRVGS
jgi:hypothetical protein